MNIKDLISKSNLKNRQFGEKVGLSPSQVSLIANKKAKVTPMLEKICSYVFWKELGVPREEIIKELGLDDPGIAPIYASEENSSHGIAPDREKLEKMVEQLRGDNRILMQTLENLNKQLEK